MGAIWAPSVSGAKPQPRSKHFPRHYRGLYMSAGWGKVAVIFSDIRPKSGGTVPPLQKLGGMRTPRKLRLCDIYGRQPAIVGMLTDIRINYLDKSGHKISVYFFIIIIRQCGWHLMQSFHSRQGHVVFQNFYASFKNSVGYINTSMHPKCWWLN